MNEYAPLIPIMQRRGAKCTPQEFHSAVNVTFHKYESEVYDQLHQDMWDSLPRQFSLLVDDCLKRFPAVPSSLRMLDVGCGTGLASDCMMRTQLGPAIKSVDLIDTSAAMLAKASNRAARWNVPYTVHEGILEYLQGREPYDVIVTCSVLHHVPNLNSFMDSVTSLQRPGGLFIHLQDPNGDAMNDPELKARMDSVNRHELPQWLARWSPRRVIGRLSRELNGTQGQDYVSRANRELLAAGFVQSLLTVEEIFSITDIHVHDEQGVSVGEIRKLLPGYDLVSKRTYGFFGRLESTLTGNLKKEEDRLIAEKVENGFHVGAAWQRR